jgi:hypothetical protein
VLTAAEWLITALAIANTIAARYPAYCTKGRHRMPQPTGPFLTTLERAAKNLAERRRRPIPPAAVLHEQAERFDPYGPPPREIDQDVWDEITEATFLGGIVIGLTLTHTQVRELAAFLADRLIVKVAAEQRTDLEAVTA